MLEESNEEESEDIPLAEYRGLIARGDVATFRRRWAHHPLMQLETRSPPLRDLLERMTARYSGKDLLQELPEPEDHWDRAITALLRTPALIITGEHDLPARVRAADALSQALPTAQRAIVGAARHIPSLDNPLMYNSVLRAFLGRHAGSLR
jgi:pimeloyl-ACP methyl ester carboxylesterase